MFPDLTRDDVFRLETRRLWLRWPRRADSDAIVRLAGEKAVAEMMRAIPHPYSHADATSFLIDARASNTEGRSLVLAVTPRSEPGTLIGVVGIRAAQRQAPSLGYWLGMPYWGEGFATEAARALVDAFFAYTPGQELTSYVRVINPASRNVLEKCGFAAVGTGLKPFPARGGVLPVDHFRLDRRKWRSLKAWSAADYVPLSSSRLDPERPVGSPVAASLGAGPPGIESVGIESLGIESLGTLTASPGRESGPAPTANA